MTIKNYKMITCECCGVVDYYETTSNKVAREVAHKSAGWVYINGADVCKKCYEDTINRVFKRGQTCIF